MNKWRLLASIIYRFFRPIDNVTKYRKMGATIGKNVYIAQQVTFDSSHIWLIHIGNNVGIAPFTHILAHDGTTKQYLGYARIGMVVIEDNVIIGAGCTILPGVKIGKNSIVGCKSLVVNDIPANCVAAGNPAKYICSLEDYVIKQKELFNSSVHFDESYTLKGNLTEVKKSEMIEILTKNRIAFIE